MNIVADSQVFIRQRHGGVSRYFNNLESTFGGSTDYGVNFRIISPFHYNAYLSNRYSCNNFRCYVPRFPNLLRPRLQILSSVISERQFQRFSPSLIHETFYSQNESWPKVDVPRVTTIHDMIREKLNNNVESLARKRAAIARSKHVICISNSTMYDMLDLIECDPDKVSVVYLGVNKPTITKDSNRANLYPGKPYFLFVGQRHGYKNFHFLLRSFFKNETLRHNFKIVAFGGLAPTKEELNLIQSLGVDGDSIIFDSGADWKLSLAYLNATALIYPSLYEGFGLPPLEAMAHGCPVISSNTSSLPEVLGDAALLIDPNDDESLQFSMIQIASDNSLKNQMSSRGLLKVQEYTWENSAKKHAEIYAKSINR